MNYVIIDQLNFTKVFTFDFGVWFFVQNVSEKGRLLGEINIKQDVFGFRKFKQNI